MSQIISERTKLIGRWLAPVCLAFHREHTDPLVKAYEIGLDGLSDKQVEQVMTRAIRECRFMPTPAELRELSEGSKQDRALAAWESVAKCLRENYRFDDNGPKWKCPVVARVIRAMGGWYHLCYEVPSHDLFTWKKKEFVELYRNISERGPELLPVAEEAKAIGVDIKRIGVTPN